MSTIPRPGQAYWEAHLEAITNEGIDTKAYAAREGLAVSNLYYWRRRLKIERAGAKSVATASPARAQRLFVPVELGRTPDTGRCLLVLNSGVRLELSHLPDPQWLAQVSQALSGQVR